MTTRTKADKAITVRVDGDTKNQAERMLDEMGINMTTYVASSLKALVRERKIPFEMVTTEYLNDQIILAKLAEVEADTNIKWLTRDEVMQGQKVRDYNPRYLLDPDTTKTPVFGCLKENIEIPSDFDEPIEEMKEYMH